MRLGHSTFEHVNAVHFEFAIKDGVRTLVIGTDLRDDDWSETLAGKSSRKVS